MATAIQPLDVKLPEVAEQVHAIHLSAYSQEAELVGVKSLPPMERNVSHIQSLSETFFGAFVNGVLVGTISVFEGEESQVQICSLAVHPAFQRLGVGRALVEAAICRAAGKSTQVSTAAANLPAISLYRSLGFQVLRHSLVQKLHLQLVHLQRLGSNPSVKGTSCGKPQAVPYVER